jgi:hypothetical protein
VIGIVTVVGMVVGTEGVGGGVGGGGGGVGGGVGGGGGFTVVAPVFVFPVVLPPCVGCDAVRAVVAVPPAV